MAKGRMLNRVIASSHKFSCVLEDDFERLLFCMLIPFSDVDGRLIGEADLVKSMCFPRRQDVTVEQVENALRALDRAGLIQYYLGENDLCVQINKFHDEQRVDRSREKESQIPPPSLELPESIPELPESTPELPKSTPELPESTPELPQSSHRKLAINIKSNNKININCNTKKTNSLFIEIKELFEKEQVGNRFTDYAKEGRAIKGLIQKANNLTDESPDVLLLGMIQTFHDLRSHDKFYRTHPYLPSSLNSSGIWDRVLTVAQDKHKQNVAAQSLPKEAVF